MEIVEIKAYTKSQLAKKYGKSVKTISNWIKRNQNLSFELNETGYCETTKLFTPYQVELIFKHLGTP